jgi:GR25 family glycosyltransferase involved in LPS biosynthesis
MLTFDKNNTFCISLLSNKERYEKMKKRFQILNMDVTIWPASTPETLTSNFTHEYLNNGTKACSQSHYNIWKYMFEHKMDYAMILEDDACFDKLFFEKLEQFNHDVNDNEWDAIFLNASEPIHDLNKWVKVQEQFLTGGYILSLRGVNKLLSMYSEYLHGSDWMTSRLQLYNHCYSYFPWIIIQEGNETTIGSNVDLDHKKVLRCLNEIDYSLDNYII